MNINAPIRCICVMGGDRVCPDDCPHAAYENLPPTKRTQAHRQAVAKKLYEEGKTMEQIAAQFGVTTMTISNDLSAFKETLNVKGQGKDTLGRKRSTGRPKKEKKMLRPQQRKNTSITAEAAAKLILNNKKNYVEAEIETGLSNTVLRSAVAREEGRRESEATIDQATLSLTAQEKLAAAMRQQERRLNSQFEQRVLDEVKRRIDVIVLPHWKEKIEQAQELYAHRRGAMDKATFNKIRRALHPDSRNSISDKMLGEAFDNFMALEKFLLDEKESPTDLSGLPKTWNDWEKAKKDAAAERRARRARGETSELRRT